MRAILLALCALAVAVRAQDGWDKLGVPALEAKREEAKTRRAALGDPVPAEKKELHDALSERLDLLDELLRTLEERGGLLSEGEIRRRQAEAVAALDEVRRQPGGVDVSEEARRDAQRAFDLVAAERRNREEGLTKLRERLEASRKSLDELPAREVAAKEKVEAAREAADSELARYRVENADLGLHVVRTRTAFLQDATSRWTLRLPMEQAQVDLARTRFDIAQEKLNRIHDALARDLKDESKRAREEASAAAAAAARETDPVARFRKQARADSLRLKAERKDLEALATRLDRQIGSEREWVRSLDEEREALERRLAVQVAVPGQSAALLRATLDRAKRARTVLGRQSLPDLYRETGRVNSATADVLDRLFGLQQPLEQNAEYLDLRTQAGGGRVDEARTGFQEGRDEVVTALRDQRVVLEQVSGKLSELEKLFLTRIEKIDSLQTLVLSRLIWIRTDPPLDWALLPKIGAELKRLAAVFGSSELLAGVGRAFAAGAWRFLGALLGVVLVLAVGLLAVPRLRRVVHAEPRPGAGAMALRILTAIVMAALPPATLIVAGIAVGMIELPDVFSQPVRRLLFVWAGFWFPRRLAKSFLGVTGVGVRDRWISTDLARQLLIAVNLITVGGLFLRAPAAALAVESLDMVHLPRVLLTAFRGMVAFVLILLVRRRGALIHGWTGGSGFVYRAWGLIGPLLTIGLFGTVVMDVLGYREGARFFLFGMVQSLVAALLLAGLYTGLQRLVETIAAHVRRRTQREEGARAAWETSEAVLRQLTRVSSALVIILAVVLLAGFWDIDNALRVFFEGVKLTEVGDGEYLTLWSIFSALAWIAGGHFLVYNLSALYQFLFGGAAEIGGQYVAVALTRYVVLLIAYGAALLELRFSFASLGWLLAAASVGLGFGLQEIVANFVSGLILLFERPIRVGDIITVGDTGGVVEKINIRATIVTNWDRQQIIVPNKAFITQNLTNWTRNDLITRRKVQVGVAYGSDIETVLKILHEVVAPQPGIRKDPPPRIFFEAFGDSSLLFEVWFFCPVPDGKPLMSAVRTEIDRRFREANITIPFPQRDLHLKSVDETTGLGAMLEKRGDQP